MSLDDLTRNTDGETINTVERAVEVMNEMKEEFGEYPTQKKWTKHKEEFGISTPGDTLKRQTGKTFQEIKEISGGNVTIDSVETAIEMIEKYEEKYGEMPIVKNWDDRMDEMGVNTAARHFKSNTGKTFGEIKEIVSGDKSRVRLTEDVKQPSAAKAYCIGVILGDGNVGEREIKGKNETAKVIQLNTKDKDFAEEFARQLCKWLDISWDGWGSDDTAVSCGGPYQQENENAKNVYHVSKEVANAYEHLMRYQDAESEEILELRNEFEEYKADLLRGLWDAEGHINVDGKIGFTNAENGILELYMKLVNDIIGTKLDEKGEWTTDSKHSKKYGEFRVTERLDWGARQVYIPTKYRDDFFNKIQPTIQRKCDRFKEYLNDNSSVGGIFDNIIDKES